MTYASVKGSVTLDGKPMQSGSVTFVPKQGTDGGGSSGIIGKDGTFELVGPKGQGVPIGEYTILVHCPQEGSGPDTGENPSADVPPCTVPRKYTLETSSDITNNVKEGTNEVQIELFSKKKT